MLLIISILVCATVPIFASEIKEEYLADLRLIYADDYEDAKSILNSSEFKTYKIYNRNLNEGTGETGVWLAYKTTTDIEDAITDISIIEMNGGYMQGNYQEVIKQSRDQYKAMARVYANAISYFADAYEAGHFLAEIAYRQLNYYTAVTDPDLGIEIPDFDGERLGDIFLDIENVSTDELATIFMEGNSYALNNIRSLLAMGVSYNEDGKHYLEKVAEAVEMLEEDPYAFEDDDFYDDYDELAVVVAQTIKSYKTMFEELSCYESEMNFYDSDLTDLEYKYVDHKSLADRFREVEYLDGKTLYSFCMDYEYSEDDFSALYPLIYALNEGQIAMTQVVHYNDVVYYSMSDYPEEELISEIEEQEKIYSEYPFDIYLGVDRSIYYGTFALTSDAYRADAYTQEGLINHLFYEETAHTVSGISAGAGSILLGAWAINRTLAAIDAGATVSAAKEVSVDIAYALNNIKNIAANDMAITPTLNYGISSSYGDTCLDVVNALYAKSFPHVTSSISNNMTFNAKLYAMSTKPDALSNADFELVQSLTKQYKENSQFMQATYQKHQEIANEVATTTTGSSKLALFGTGVLYLASAALLLYSAYRLGHTVWDYYHPKYEDIPVALVDLIVTADGDRFIKYDAVFNAETNDAGVYRPGDLNAFAGQRWNAVYYTKSYEAGKPLLADSFAVSSSNSTPKDGYAPVHRFGEVVCYQLNKYNYKGETKIFLSVKQSKNDKFAVAGVPEVVGTVFGTGFFVLAGGIGLIAGIGGTLGTQLLLKKRKESATPLTEDEPLPEASEP